MKHTIAFTKMEGAGNDYIYVDAARFPLDHPEAFAEQWSRPHTGIGSDGLVLIFPSDVADFRMRIFNADGSEAMMCGNASRCIGKYVYEHGLTRKTDLTLETLSGVKRLHLHVEDGTVRRVTVDMGCPVVGAELAGETAVLTARGRYEGTVVSMGNPHFVIFTSDVAGVDLSAEGPLLERHERFPGRTNVEFAQVRSAGHIRMRVWERGSGITQACGTGACATAVAAIHAGRCGRRTVIEMDGGLLEIEWRTDDNHVYMTGEARTVYEGTIITN